MLILQTILLSATLVAPSVAATPSAMPVQLAQVYTDLPGVKRPEDAEQSKVVICEQSVIEQARNPTYGQRYRTVNNCHRGNGPVFQSPRTPLSLERMKRGLNY